MKRRSRWIGLLLAVCLGVVTGCVSTSVQERSPEQVAEAERLFREGFDAQVTLRQVDEIRAFKASAELGHVVAMVFYAEACERGYNPERSLEKAEKWYERSEALAKPKAKAGAMRSLNSQCPISLIRSN